MSTKTIRIGGGAGFWGDSPEGARQLILHGNIDYLVFDYLAEITMSILARARERKPELGYATDFVTHFIGPYAQEIARRGIKIVANAGGVNPLGCKAAIEKLLAQQGVNLKVAAVVGDDIVDGIDGLRAQVRELETGARLPDTEISANAYFGAFPIAAALGEGADIVVTGRCVDSAVALGPLIHEFGWQRADHDLLAAGSLTGHILECGPQCTGGFFTDWEEVCAGWADIGFPIAECRVDGSFVVTKPPGTGGMVTRATVAEQVTYETGDPANYLLPDVVCDWSDVVLTDDGPDRVRVAGARGKPPTGQYKVSATWSDGFRCLATLLIKGRQAVPKARAVGAAILARSAGIFEREGLEPFSETSIEVLGAEDTYGPHARTSASREVVLKVAARHRSAAALDIFAREIFPVSTSTVQGVAGAFGGRPKVQPLIRLFSFLIDCQQVPSYVDFGDRRIPVAPPVRGTQAVATPESRPSRVSDARVGSAGDAGQDTVMVPLIALAYARSGDKGDISSIAVLARHPELRAPIETQLTPDSVAAFMGHLVQGRVERFAWPGLDGWNFLLHQALGGGGVASLRYDPQGKGHAQALLDFPVRIPASWLQSGLLLRTEVYS